MGFLSHVFWSLAAIVWGRLHNLSERLYARTWDLEKRCYRKARIALGDDSYLCEDCGRFVSDTEVCSSCLREVCRLCMRDRDHTTADSTEETDEHVH